jgi:hypothetical protein
MSLRQVHRRTLQSSPLGDEGWRAAGYGRSLESDDEAWGKRKRNRLDVLAAANFDNKIDYCNGLRKVATKRAIVVRGILARLVTGRITSRIGRLTRMLVRAAAGVSHAGRRRNSVLFSTR